MIKRRIFLFFLCLVMARASFAVIPENGWWWASNESGRGFNIEIQDNLLFFATFAYETNGAPVWLIAGGPMTSDRDFTNTLTKFTAGQCFGCPYVAPVPVAAGTLSLHFTSSQTAVLTVNGTSISVKRFDFWGKNEIAPDAMLGEWSYVIGSAAFPIFDGERIQFRQKQTSSTGPFVAGARLGASTNVAVAGFDFNRGVWTVLLDSSATFYRYFEFSQTGFNRVEGSFWLFDKTASPTGSGTFFQGHRTASSNFVQTGVGPASSKSLVDLTARDALMASYTQHTGEKAVDAGTAKGFEQMKDLLRETQSQSSQ